MLGYVYSSHHTSSLASNLDLGVKIATPVGTLVGQLLFGWLADIVGRKRMCTYPSNILSLIGLMTFVARRH